MLPSTLFKAELLVNSTIESSNLIHMFSSSKFTSPSRRSRCIQKRGRGGGPNLTLMKSHVPIAPSANLSLTEETGSPLVAWLVSVSEGCVACVAEVPSLPEGSPDFLFSRSLLS